MPIQTLPARLANQIAAGEVVERPSSVVKELVENSLDSGADSISIDIEKGGHKRILIRDNGGGIPREELALALSRHATSKISSLDDLAAICSLGFRGEALASISSVARLSLSSKTKEQAQAWQANCEGRDMQVQLNPVAHPDGTSVDVADLFFNTPARRKFLRTEKTEFSHIDEVVRRIALSRFDVSFSLRHNGKLLRKYPAVSQQGNELKRLAAICGSDFAKGSIELNSQYQKFELKGWLAQPELASAQGNFQYFYVNGRMMRDKLINHAVRQAFEELINHDHFPAYVLYLTIEPEQVDVNVHPAKHEVRFHQARLVHDFIFRALTDSLNQYFEQGKASSEPGVLAPVEPNHDYIQPLQSVTNKAVHESSGSYAVPDPSSANVISARSSGGRALPYKKGEIQNIGQSSINYQQLMKPSDNGTVDENLLTANSQIKAAHHVSTVGQWLRLSNRQILANVDSEFYIIDIADLQENILLSLYSEAMPVSQPLLMPVSISATPELLAQVKKLHQSLLDNSVEMGWTPNRVILRKVPAGFRQFPWAEELEKILACENIDAFSVRKHLLKIFSQQKEVIKSELVDDLWRQLLMLSSDMKLEIQKIGKRTFPDKLLVENE